jgi:hypothetical protein
MLNYIFLIFIFLLIADFDPFIRCEKSLIGISSYQYWLHVFNPEIEIDIIFDGDLLETQCLSCDEK